MPIRPRKNRVYIIPIEDPDTTPGGLYVPPTAKQRVDQGIVKYRGAGTHDVRVGDHVLFSGYSGDQINVKGDGLLYVMQEEFILAIIEEGNPHELFTSDDLHLLISRAISRLRANEDFPNDMLSALEERLTTLIDNRFYEDLHF